MNAEDENERRIPWKTGKRTWKLLLTMAGLTLFLLLALSAERNLTLDWLQSRGMDLVLYYNARPVVSACLYLIIYALAAGLSLPASIILSLAAGAVFGPLWGTALAVCGATAGAGIAFTLSRLAIREFVQRRYGRFLEACNRGVARNGAWYLLALRLIPAVPYFVVNLAMGLTSIRLVVFLPVSLVGMLPAAFVYVNAGTQLAQLRSPEDVFSPGMLLALTLLGLLTLLPLLVQRWGRGLLRKAAEPWTEQRESRDECPRL